MSGLNYNYVVMIEKEVASALEVLDRGGLILYPTDTIWGIGCKATSTESIERIYELKRRPGHKAMLCLVSNYEMLVRYTGEIDERLKPYVLKSERATTVIYPGVSGVSPALLGADGSLGIRLTSDPFCRWLIRSMDEALVSTSANISGAPNPRSFSEISEEILKGVDYIVHLRQDEIQTAPSRIIKSNEDGTLEVLRD